MTKTASDILFDLYIEELERTILLIEYELEWRRENEVKNNDTL